MKLFFKLLVGFVGLFFTITIVAILYIATLDPNDHKDWIVERFQEETGHALTLNGDIELSIYPWLGLTLNNISIADDPLFRNPLNNENFFSAERIEARIKLMPLINGDYEIDTLRLHNITVNLISNNEGEGNWESFSSNTENEDNDNEVNSEFTIPQIQIGGVDIQNINITYTDQATDQRYSLNDLNISTDALTLGEPIAVALSAIATASEPDIQADIDLTATLSYDLDGQAFSLSPLALDSTISGSDVPNGQTSFTANTDIELDLSEDSFSIPRLSASIMNMSIAAALNGNDIQTTPKLSGSLTVNGDKLSDLFRLAGQNELAEQLDELSDQSVAIETALSFDVDRGDLELPSLSARLLGATVEGNLNARNLNSQAPQISGNLNAEGPDLPALLIVAGQLQGRDSALSTYGQSLGKLNRAQKTFRANTRFDANLEQGNVQLPQLEIQTLGIAVSGQLNAANMNSDTGSAQGKFTVQGDNLKPLLAAIDQQAASEVLNSANLQVEIAGQGQALTFNPMTLSLGLTGDQVPNGSATLTMNANGGINLANDSLSVNSFSVAGLGLNANGSLNGTSISESPSFNGQINIPTTNLRNFAAGVNLPLPDSADPETLKAVALNTNYQISDQGLILDDLLLTLDGSKLTGDFSSINNNTSFNLAIDAINLDRYLTEATESAPAESEEGEFDLENLKNFTVNGRVTIGSLIYSNLKLANIIAEVNADDGLLNLAPISADLYEGTYAGEIRVDASKATPSASMATSLTNINLEPLMLDFLGDSFVSGYGNITLALNGSGLTTGAIRQSLSGSGNINLVDGVLKGVDVGSILAQVESMIHNRRVAQLDRGQQTAFDSFSSTLNIDSGVATTNDLLISAPGFSVSGRGILADLRNETINFQLIASVDESTATTNEEEYDIGGYSIPVACTGAIASPSCLPDIQQIISAAITNELQRQVGGFLQRALGVESTEEATGETTTDTNTESAEDSTEEKPDPREELLNRALEGLFR